MKVSPCRFLPNLAALLLMVMCCRTASGSTVVFSNLVPGVAGNAFRLVDSHGSPLAAGCWIGLGHFGNLGESEIVALAKQGPDVLFAAFSPFGDPASVGTGADTASGRFEFAASTPLASPLSGLCAVIFNSSSPATATEILIVSLPGMVPADDASGLVGYLAVHLEDASLIVGNEISGELATTVQAGKFESWMAAQTSAEISPDQLLPNADADGDGLDNLLEYALGSLAGNPASRTEMETIRESGLLRLRFLSRSDDPELVIDLQTSINLMEGSWITTSPAPLEVSSPLYPAPAGFRWVQFDIPSSEEQIFARLRVILAP